MTTLVHDARCCNCVSTKIGLRLNSSSINLYLYCTVIKFVSLKVNSTEMCSSKFSFSSGFLCLQQRLLERITTVIGPKAVVVFVSEVRCTLGARMQRVAVWGCTRKVGFHFSSRERGRACWCSTNVSLYLIIWHCNELVPFRFTLYDPQLAAQ